MHSTSHMPSADALLRASGFELSKPNARRCLPRRTPRIVLPWRRHAHTAKVNAARWSKARSLQMALAPDPAYWSPSGNCLSAESMAARLESIYRASEAAQSGTTPGLLARAARLLRAIAARLDGLGRRAR